MEEEKVVEEEKEETQATINPETPAYTLEDAQLEDAVAADDDEWEAAAEQLGVHTADAEEKLDGGDAETETKTEEEQEPSDLENRVAALDEARKRDAKRIEDQDQFIRRQGTEIGKLRKDVNKKVNPYANLTDEEIQQKVLDDPASVRKAIDDAQKPVEEEEPLTPATDVEAKVRKIVLETVPDFEDLKPTMAELALEDGESQEAVNRFKDNPWDFDPGSLFGYALRARTRLNDASKPKPAETETDAEKKKADVREAAAKIKAAATKTTPMKGGSGQALPAHRVPVKPFAEMTRKQLDDYLEQTAEE